MTPSSQFETCSVTWCIWPPGECTGDHFAGPGGESWPGVVATAYDLDRAPRIAPAPVWGQSDGLDPAVVLYLTDGVFEDGLSADLRPTEARQLAFALIRAAEAAESCAGMSE